MYSKELLKGTLKTIVLKLLSDQEKMYGYEITQHVKSATAGKVVLTEGALYPTLHKLEAEGLVETEKVLYGGRTRKYYKLTESGLAAATRKVNEFEEFVSTMKFIFKGNLSTEI
ncbi:MAG: PadR family transcriptional regulator [Cyclobacteriaceae bacterium]